MAVRLVVITVLLVGCWDSFRLLASAAVSRQVDTHLGQLKHVRDAERKLAAEKLEQVLRIDARNPDTFRMVAEVSLDPLQKLSYLQELVAVRPRDSEAWAMIFSLRLAQAENPDSTRTALANAVATGPFEPITLNRIVDAGTRYWLRLGEAERRVVMLAAARSLGHSAHYQRAETRRLLIDRGFLSLACSLVEEKPDSCSA